MKNPTRTSLLGLRLVCAAALIAVVAVTLSDARPIRAQSAPPPTDQAAAPLPSFEVVSIKPYVQVAGAMMRAGSGATDPSRWTALNETVKGLICEAYDLYSFQVIGGPAWIDSARFDIDAKVDDTTAAQLQTLSRHQQNQQMDLMLRSLLIDRFKLRVTRETKDEPAFALVIAKGGPKLKETAGGQGVGRMSANNGQITATSTNISMSNFAKGLSVQLGKPVLDQTGLTANYDITWHYTTQTGLSPDASASDTAGPTMFDALQDQLGLKLELTRAPTETIAIDHIEEPTPN